MKDRQPKRPPEVVQKWRQRFRAAFESNWVRQPSTYFMTRLAAHVALIGPPDDEDADRVYWALVALFANSRHKSRWSQALEEIGPDEQRLFRVRDCVEAYRDQIGTAGGRSLQDAKFNLADVVEVMVQIPDGTKYVKECRKGGLTQPGSIFHPNTLDHKRRKMRGLFGRSSDDNRASEDYASQLKEKLSVTNG